MLSSSLYVHFINALTSGDICVFETDTVVGIGCSLLKDGVINKNNISKIFDIKKRNLNKKLPWLVSSNNMVNEFAININKNAQNLIEKKWPGATTFILEIKNNYENLKEIVCNDNEKLSVAFRIPDVEEIINAIDFAGCPILCTSANLSGEDPVHYIDDVNPKLLNSADFIYDKKLFTGKNEKPSEIINCLNEDPVIIRA